MSLRVCVVTASHAGEMSDDREPVRWRGVYRILRSPRVGDADPITALSTISEILLIFGSAFLGVTVAAWSHAKAWQVLTGTLMVLAGVWTKAAVDHYQRHHGRRG